MTTEEKLDIVVTWILNNVAAPENGADLLGVLSENEKFPEPPKPEPKKWWLTCNKTEILSFWTGPTKPEYHSESWINPYNVGLHCEFNIEGTYGFLKHLRPDLILPEPGECIELPNFIYKAHWKEIGKLNNEIKELTQRCETAWNNNYKVLKQNEKLKGLHLKAVDECLESECQNHKMRKWIERIPFILHENSMLGISAKHFLDSLNET